MYIKTFETFFFLIFPKLKNMGHMNHIKPN